MGGDRGAYGLQFKKQTAYQPTFMYRALADGEADVISAFSSDGRIAADHLVVLADPRHALPPYDAVILISPRRARDPPPPGRGGRNGGRGGERDRKRQGIDH